MGKDRTSFQNMGATVPQIREERICGDISC